MMKMEQVTIVTSGGQIYICRLRDRFLPSLYPPVVRTFQKANKVTKGKGGGGGGEGSNEFLLPQERTGKFFPDDNTCTTVVFPPSSSKKSNWLN